jgi:hypothetical protein
VLLLQLLVLLLLLHLLVLLLLLQLLVLLLLLQLLVLLLLLQLLGASSISGSLETTVGSDSPFISAKSLFY